VDSLGHPTRDTPSYESPMGWRIAQSSFCIPDQEDQEYPRLGWGNQ